MIDDLTRKQNIEYYDAEAAVYDETRYSTTEGRRVDLFQKKILANYLNELPVEAKVLELGCGTGRFIPHLIHKGYQLTAIDNSQKMLEKARERIHVEVKAPVEILQTEANSIPFDDDSFDAVYSILVINLIQDYQMTFKEVARVVKPGGLFIFNVPNLNSIYFPAGIYVNLRGRTTTRNSSGYRYSHWFTRLELRSALRNAGFVLEEVQGQPSNVGSRDEVTPLCKPVIRWLLAKSVYIKARRSGR